MEFEKVWKSLGDDVLGQARYLGMLDPPGLPGLFRHALTAQLLHGMLSALLKGLTALNCPHALALLAALPRVPRFDMALMCLPARDKAELAQQWDIVARLLPPEPAAALQELRAAYKL
jgi:hypothetical protein